MLTSSIREVASRRIAVIEAMRGLAALAVALYHFSHPLRSDVPRWLEAYGWLGVDVFFVISGVVVPLSLHGRGYGARQFPAFMARRIVRIEPAYLASIALTLAVWHLSTLAPAFRGGPPDYSLPQLAAHAFYLIPLTDYAWLSPVYWSLAFEFAFYCLLGLLFPLLVTRRPEWSVALAALAAAALVLAHGRTSLLAYPVEFLVGLLVMRLIVREGDPRPLLFWLFVALGAIFIVGGVRGLVVVAAALVILRWHGLQLGRWAVWCGAVSYALYLTHVPIGGRVVNLLTRFGDGAAFDLVVIAAATLSSIAFAALFAWLVEFPSIRASRRFFATPAPLDNAEPQRRRINPIVP